LEGSQAGQSKGWNRPELLCNLTAAYRACLELTTHTHTHTHTHTSPLLFLCPPFFLSFGCRKWGIRYRLGQQEGRPVWWRAFLHTSNPKTQTTALSHAGLGVQTRSGLLNLWPNLFHQATPLKHTHIYTPLPPDLLFQSTLIFSLSVPQWKMCVYTSRREWTRERKLYKLTQNKDKDHFRACMCVWIYFAPGPSLEVS